MSQTGATLNASVNPKGTPAEVRFEWGTSAVYGNTTAPVSIAASNAAVPRRGHW